MRHIIWLVLYMTAVSSIAFCEDSVSADAPCVIARADGSYEMRLDLENALRHGDRAAVYWEDVDGALHSRKIYAGTSSNGLGAHHALVPRHLVHQPDGSWTLPDSVWTVVHGPSGHWRTEIPGSDYVEVLDLNTPVGLRAAPMRSTATRGVNLLPSYDNTGKPDGVEESEVVRAISNAIIAVNTLLANDLVPAVIHFEWNDFSSTPGSESTLARAHVDSSSVALSTTLSFLETTYTTNDMDSYENTFHVYFLVPACRTTTAIPLLPG